MKNQWWYAYCGIDGHMQVYAEEPKGYYGVLYGPFPSFTAAKRDLIATVKHDIMEVKMSLHEAKALKKPKKG
jgi:hypothetical protein